MQAHLLCVLALQELRILGIEQQMWHKRHSSNAEVQLQASTCTNEHNSSSTAATAAAAVPLSSAESTRSHDPVAAAAPGDLSENRMPADGSPGQPSEQETLQLAPSLLPIASEEDSAASTARVSLLAAKQSVHINFGIMSLPALSFPGSASGSGVPVSKACKAAGLRTG
jgi:hypothetical protein